MSSTTIVEQYIALYFIKESKGDLLYFIKIYHFDLDSIFW